MVFGMSLGGSQSSSSSFLVVGFLGRRIRAIRHDGPCPKEFKRRIDYKNKIQWFDLFDRGRECYDESWH